MNLIIGGFLSAFFLFGMLVLGFSTNSSQILNSDSLAYTDYDDPQMGARLCYVEIATAKPICPEQQHLSSVSQPLWSPNGRSIGFVANSGGYWQQIHVLELSTYHITRLTHLKSPIQDMAWLDDRRIVFTVLDSTVAEIPTLALFEVDTVSATLIEIDSQLGMVAKIEPLTRQVVFMTVDPKLKQSDLMLYDLDQRKEVRFLTSDRYIKVPAAWSPNAANIAYFQAQGESPTAPIDFWVVSRDGQTKKRVGQIEGMAYSYHDTSITWSPDAQKIAAISQNELYVWDVTTGAQEQLTSDGEIKVHPRWSANGKYIAYLKQETNGWGLYVFNLSDGESHFITTSSDTAPSWKPSPQ